MTSVFQSSQSVEGIFIWTDMDQLLSSEQQTQPSKINVTFSSNAPAKSHNCISLKTYSFLCALKTQILVGVKTIQKNHKELIIPQINYKENGSCNIYSFYNFSVTIHIQSIFPYFSIYKFFIFMVSSSFDITIYIKTSSQLQSSRSLKLYSFMVRKYV